MRNEILFFSFAYIFRGKITKDVLLIKEKFAMKFNLFFKIKMSINKNAIHFDISFVHKMEKKNFLRIFTVVLLEIFS